MQLIRHLSSALLVLVAALATPTTPVAANPQLLKGDGWTLTYRSRSGKTDCGQRSIFNRNSMVLTLELSDDASIPFADGSAAGVHVSDTPKYRDFLRSSVVPEAMKLCPSSTRVFVRHHIKGYWIDRRGFVYPKSKQLRVFGGMLSDQVLSTMGIAIEGSVPTKFTYTSYRIQVDYKVMHETGLHSLTQLLDRASTVNYLDVALENAVEYTQRQYSAEYGFFKKMRAQKPVFWSPLSRCEAGKPVQEIIRTRKRLVKNNGGRLPSAWC